MSRYRAPAGVMYVENLAQKVLFDCEIKGQLSDGFWENSKPYDHWMPWCDATVEVALNPRAVGITFYPRRDKYALTSPELLSVVGKRMIGTVRIALALGYKVARDLHVDCDGTLTYPVHAGEYGAGERKKIDAIGMEKIQAALNAPIYTELDLKLDLRALMRIMKIGPLDRKLAFPDVEKHDRDVVTFVKNAREIERLSDELSAMKKAEESKVSESEETLRALANGGQY